MKNHGGFSFLGMKILLFVIKLTLYEDGEIQQKIS